MTLQKQNYLQKKASKRNRFRKIEPGKRAPSKASPGYLLLLLYSPIFKFVSFLLLFHFTGQLIKSSIFL